MLSVHQSIPLVALALNLLLMGSALVGDRRHQRNFLFAWVALGLSIWNLGVFGLRATTDAASAMEWERLVHFGVIPVPVLFYHYVLVFLDAPRRSAGLALGYALAATLVAVSPTPWFLEGVVPSVWGFMPAAGPLYGPFLLYFYVYLLLGLGRLAVGYRSTTSAFRRNRIRVVIVGASVTVLGGAVDFLRFVLGWEWLYPLGIPSNAVFTIALGIAIVRYRLWDISLLAKRFVLYALLAVGLVPLITLGVVQVFRWMNPDTVWWPSIPMLFVLLAVVATLLPFLRKVEIAFERFMFSSQHGVRDALTALSKEMASILDVTRLGLHLTEGLVRRVPVLHARLYLCAAQSGEFVLFAQAESSANDGPVLDARLEARLVLWLRVIGKPLTVEEIAYQAGPEADMRDVLAPLETARIALLVPLLLDGEVTAILAVGEKVSGAVFDSSEIELVQTLMAQAGIALKNARLYQDLQHQMEELRATQQQLIQAAKFAAIGELAASVAHELNNPLTVIVGRSEQLIRKAPPGSLAVELGETIKREALRSSRITRGLLDFARRREPKREPLNVNALVTRALDLVQSKLRGDQIVVETMLDPAVPALLGDSDQLLQVLINLVGNAIDAMPDDGRLVVRTEPRRESDAVLISVTDSGVGMTTDQMARIFEPFYTTKPDGKGTGLGLSVTLGILKSHGGSIAVDSAPGHGTTMTVELPISSVAEPDAYEGAR